MSIRRSHLARFSTLNQLSPLSVSPSSRRGRERATRTLLFVGIQLRAFQSGCTRLGSVRKSIQLLRTPVTRNRIMAGGRRPASYVAGTRHNTGVDRQQTLERPVSPTISSVSSTSLPLWIPSIWQPQPATIPQAKETASNGLLASKPPNPNADASSALAAALDTAVQSAVVRALGTSGSIPSPSPHVSSTVSSDAGADDDPITNVHATTQENELTETVEHLRFRLRQRDEDVQMLAKRLDSMQQKLEDADLMRNRQNNIISELSTQIQSLTDAVSKDSRKQDTRITSLREQYRVTQAETAKMKDALTNLDTDTGALSRATREIKQDINQIRATTSTEFERIWGKMDRLDGELRSSVGKLEEIAAEQVTSSPCESESMKRTIDATTENVVSMRSRLKRVESLVTDVSKQTNDSSALRNGFEDSIKEALDETRASVSALRAETSRLRGSMSKGDDLSEHRELLSERMNILEGSLKALKKLIESNLRTQWSAEGIVKEQVSLITKHVCVAMRQYTARRIAENNTLIDEALRARIPEYAKNEDQFVLVREEDLAGNETVDIQKTSEMPTGGS